MRRKKKKKIKGGRRATLWHETRYKKENKDREGGVREMIYPLLH